MARTYISASANVTKCGTYRYYLSRRWRRGSTCVFIMLNPSTADALRDDPTIRRCVDFADREGCGRLHVINLMAYRATKPSALPADIDVAVGPENAATALSILSAADGPVIAAWGAHSKASSPAARMMRILAQTGRQPYALKITKSGAPGHPLYVKGDAPLIPYLEFN